MRSDLNYGETQPAPASCPIKVRWVRRLGAAAFLFFLVKGLIWLAIAAAAAVGVAWGVK